MLRSWVVIRTYYIQAESVFIELLIQENCRNNYAQKTKETKAEENFYQ